MNVFFADSILFGTNIFGPFQFSCVLKLHLQDISSHLKTVGNMNNQNKIFRHVDSDGFDRFLLDTAVWPRMHNPTGDQVSVSQCWSPAHRVATKLHIQNSL